MAKCPLCETEIEELHTTKLVSIVLKDGEWKQQINECDYSVRCPECFEDLDPGQLDELGVPNELR